MNWRTLSATFVFGCLTASAAVTNGMEAPAGAPRPNIVIILADDKY